MLRKKVSSRKSLKTGGLLLKGFYKERDGTVTVGFGLSTNGVPVQPVVFLGGAELPLGLAYHDRTSVARFLRSNKRLYLNVSNLLCYVEAGLRWTGEGYVVVTVDVYTVSPRGVRDEYTYLDKVSGGVSNSISDMVARSFMGLGELDIFLTAFGMVGAGA